MGNSGATLFIAGQGTVNAESSLVGEVDTEACSRRLFQNAVNKLKASGTTFANAVSLVIQLTDIENHQWTVRDMRVEFIDMEISPDSKVVEVSELAKPSNMIEIDMIAIRSRNR